MIRELLASSLSVACVLGGSAAAQTGDSFRAAVEFAKEKVYPALVNISVVDEEHSGGRVRRSAAAGSGVIVSPAGHVVTNYHVAGKAARIKCTLPTGETIRANIVAGDPLADLCILKLELQGRDDASVPIPFATIGDSNQLEVGDHVLALGNPLSLSSSATLGIVSNKKRVFTDFSGTEIEEFNLDGEVTGAFNQWIQHDALILPGNSGGPLCNLKGDVVGINTRGGGGVGFAIPSDTIKHVLNQALTFGEVQRGWVGCSIMPVSKAGLSEGALISYVTPDSPAAKAGLEAGDVILALNDQPVSARFFEEVPLLYQRIAELPADRSAAIRYRRGDQVHDVQVGVARMEKRRGEEAELRAHGLTVRAVTGPMAITQRYPNADGVLVTGVRPGFPFEEAKPSIDSGAVVLQVDGLVVNDIEAFRRALDQAAGKKKFPVLFRSKDELKVTLIEVGEEDKDHSGKELPKAWLGVKTQVLTDKTAEALGLAGRKGYRITQVYPWTRAQESGLKAGDVLVSMDGDELDAHRPQDAEDLKRAIEEMSIGDELEFGVIRDDQPIEVTVELEESPASSLDAKSTEQDEFEMTVRETTFMDRVNYKLPRGEDGLLVTQTRRGGWANVAGLRINDLLISVNNRAVPTVKEFDRTMAVVLEQRPKVVQLFVRRGYRTHFVFIEPDWSKIEVAK